MILQAPRQGDTQRIAYAAAPMPSAWIEYAYYLSLLYSMLAPGLGLEIPLLASAFNLLLAAICVQQLRSSARIVYAPLALLITCAITFVLVQVVVHDLSLMEEGIKTFILAIVQ